jgi:hypothetical protein
MTLDSFEPYDLDSLNLARSLEDLPHSYDGATRALPAPFGVIGFGEGALAAEFSRLLIDDATVSGAGTQFVLAGGFDFGAVDAACVIAQAAGAMVFRMGLPRASVINLSDDELTYALEEEPDEPTDDFFPVPSNSFSTYTYAQALAYLTNHADAAENADETLATLRDKCKSEIETAQNPAKQLAWSLWTRTAILLPSSGFTAQAWAWQVSLSRLGKSLSIPVAHSVLEIMASGFEARHESGDALVALLLGGEDEGLAVAREILETRVDEVIEVPAPTGEVYAANLGLWYLSCWVGLYLALLYKIDPRDSKPLEALRKK